MDLFFGSQSKYLAALLPGGTILNTFLNQFNEKPYDDKLNVSPVVSTGESAITGVATLLRSTYDDEAKVTSKTIRDVMTAIGLGTGLPTGVIGKPVKYLSDVSTGKADPSGPVDFTRGLITGRPGQQ